MDGVISVSDFEKSINSEELINILSGFGLVEPIPTANPERKIM
ncbi:hypothetical protein [Weissella paramesenteroides]|uniref:Uncharacterized protein n=1 Tax=Weissella paramesenteroides ATCC 33313 TaxID=585506 RepID=C5R897_WEIPA|nr:hypothetical protein [Weissella paramesenteroides]EER75681.1 hypothetical protein HMPREF0877_0192 [Weissella paramesenteroides ATCC 33313]